MPCNKYLSPKVVLAKSAAERLVSSSVELVAIHSVQILLVVRIAVVSSNRADALYLYLVVALHQIVLCIREIVAVYKHTAKVNSHLYLQVIRVAVGLNVLDTCDALRLTLSRTEHASTLLALQHDSIERLISVARIKEILMLKALKFTKLRESRILRVVRKSRNIVVVAHNEQVVRAFAVMTCGSPSL